jgi:signal transduction histidine kinase
MKRPLHIWLAFSLCLALAFAAVTWVSAIALRLDRAEADAQRQAAVEEDVRLALWRMDSLIAPIIARENSRPYFVYNAFYPARGAYTRMFSPIGAGEVVLPSPILAEMPQYVLLHFQFDPDGALTSPQAPAGNMRDIAEKGFLSGTRIDEAAARLAGFARLCDRREIAKLVAPVAKPSALQTAVLPPATRQQRAEPGPQRAQVANQQEISASEFQARWQNMSDQNSAAVNSQSLQNSLASPQRVMEGEMTPLWVGDSLVLARSMSVEGRDYIQGCLIDWPALKGRLLSEVADLFPVAQIEPAHPDGGADGARMLAAIPARFTPRWESAPANGFFTPLKLALIAVWATLLTAGAAAGALLFGAISLSERRGAFVSAVTHELRTPLTTFRIYTEMLAEGMVSDDAQKKEYLLTLQREAERLSRLVENVLAYSRLEKTRSPGAVEAVTVQALIDRALPRLAARSREAQMEVVVETTDAAALCVMANAEAVEQILFNLVDNAAKYASSAADKRIHVVPGREGNRAAVTVRDHGPGISKRDARKLFRPFSKSARDAANSAPGVGLGLSLCRAMAKRLGGDLRLENAGQQGAAFTFTLPLAR